mmetsp:Transcript_9409/g.17102  ORF Transcript_9409/g.17102 Transcript_9409/m.17102 type:complete len:297 (-) Transcript_9409:159-1049(-)
MAFRTNSDRHTLDPLRLLRQRDIHEHVPLALELVLLSFGLLCGNAGGLLVEDLFPVLGPALLLLFVAEGLAAGGGEGQGLRPLLLLFGLLRRLYLRALGRGLLDLLLLLIEEGGLALDAGSGRGRHRGRRNYFVRRRGASCLNGRGGFCLSGRGCSRLRLRLRQLVCVVDSEEVLAPRFCLHYLPLLAELAHGNLAGLDQLALVVVAVLEALEDLTQHRALRREHPVNQGRNACRCLLHLTRFPYAELMGCFFLHPASTLLHFESSPLLQSRGVLLNNAVPDLLFVVVHYIHHVFI